MCVITVARRSSLHVGWSLALAALFMMYVPSLVVAVPMDSSAALREYYLKYKHATTLRMDEMMSDVAAEGFNAQKENVGPEVFGQAVEDLRSDSEIKKIASHSNKQATSASEFVGDISGFFSHMFGWGDKKEESGQNMNADTNAGSISASTDTEIVPPGAAGSGQNAWAPPIPAEERNDAAREHASLDFATRVRQAYSQGKLAVELENMDETSVEDQESQSLFLEDSAARRTSSQRAEDLEHLERQLTLAGQEMEAAAEAQLKMHNLAEQYGGGSSASGAPGMHSRRNTLNVNTEYLDKRERGARGSGAATTMDVLAVQRALLDDYNDGLSKLQQLRNRIHDLNMMHEMMTHSLENMNEIIENIGDRMTDTIVNQKHMLLEQQL